MFASLFSDLVTIPQPKSGGSDLSPPPERALAGGACPGWGWRVSGSGTGHLYCAWSHASLKQRAHGMEGGSLLLLQLIVHACFHVSV